MLSLYYQLFFYVAYPNKVFYNADTLLDKILGVESIDNHTVHIYIQ